MKVWSNKSETAVFFGVEGTTNPDIYTVKLSLISGGVPITLALYDVMDESFIGLFNIVDAIDTAKARAFKRCMIRRCAKSS